MKIKVDNDDSGVRLDRWLRKKMSLSGLSRIYSLIRKGKIRINAKKCKPDHRVCAGDEVEIPVEKAEIAVSGNAGKAPVEGYTSTEFFKHNFKVIFEDDNLLICDKPAGVVVHSGTGHLQNDTLMDMAMAYCAGKLDKSNNPVQPNLVHRLDRDTSGVICLAKNRTTLRLLNSALRAGTVDKTYIAYCHGIPRSLRGTIMAELTKDFDTRDGAKVRVEPGGILSVSEYEVTGDIGNISRVTVRIRTGRTHQIRVHMAHIGCPVVGDERYGNGELDSRLFSKFKSRSLRRLYLHSRNLSFYYPLQGQKVSFNSALPSAFDRLWKLLEDKSGSIQTGGRVSDIS